MSYYCCRLFSSSAVKLNKTYFELFPATFKNLNASGFKFDTKALKKEYRKLQSINHPDLNNGLNDDKSSLINKAYDTLNDPLKRAQYIIKLEKNLDLNDDKLSKNLQFEDKQMLLEMMELHEQLENLLNEKDLDNLKLDIKNKIDEIVLSIESSIASKNWDDASSSTIKLKYYYNIKNLLKDWQPGQQITLTH